LLEAARVNETQLAERATGYYWGESLLKPFVEELRVEAEQQGEGERAHGFIRLRRDGYRRAPCPAPSPQHLRNRSKEKGRPKPP
jgi:hypothetical protein